MAKNPSKTQITLALLCASFFLMSYGMLTPLLAEIQKSFPEHAASHVQMSFTIVTIVSLPIMFLSSAITPYISKKKLTLIGLSLTLLGGFLPLVLHSRLWMLYLSSSLIGVGMGVANVITAAMISDHFTGIEKGKIMGFQAASLSLGAAVVSVLSGKIADVSSWHMAFIVYLLGIPTLLIFLRYMPDEGKSPRNAAGKLIFNRQAVWLAVIGFLKSVFITGFQTNISMFIEETGYGGVALSGIISSIFMVIGVPVGFAVGLYIRCFKRWSAVVSLAMAAAGMLIIAFSGGVAAVLIGTLLMGAAFSSYPPVAMTFMTSVVPPESSAMGVALHNGMSCAGIFISPYVLGALSGLTDGSFRSSFLVGGIALVAISALYAVTNPVKRQDLN